ncbi:MAG TPA: acyl-CoA dehydrogenase family protein, partial [Actinomycetospora sp.]|nr:acyl-CoA dehydrogenase family protein [Actinomycetospora sp.]
MPRRSRGTAADPSDLAHPSRGAARRPAERLLPTPESEDLIALVREIADEQLAPRADEAEAAEEFPRDVLRLLG